MNKRIKVIGCGVFDRELRALGQEERVEIELLDAGLHSRPKELKVRMQTAIDATDPETFERIAVAYGLCGRGAVGVMSRDIPVVFPRVHDCIALFLGSSEEYRKQFKSCPGTFYMTPGWFEKKAHPDQYRVHSLKKQWCACNDPNYAEWAGKFGAENAEFISEFFQSWRKNYRRIALINNGLGEVDKYRQYVRMLAQVSNWRFEELTGDVSFVRDLVFGPHEEVRFLVVPPHHMVIPTNDARIYSCVPAHPSEEDVLSAHRALFGVHSGTFVIGEKTAAESIRGLGLGIDAGGTYTDAVLLDFTSRRVADKAKSPTTHQELSIGIREAVGKLDREKLAEVSLVALSTTLATNSIVEGRGGHVGLILMPLDDRTVEAIQVNPVRVVPGRMTIDGQEIEPVNEAAVEQAVGELMREGVEAIAVSGYGGVDNPQHERKVKEIIHRTAGVPVVCGHELSSKLNFIRRAYTAVLNAKLIPVVDELLRSVEEAMKDYHVHAPVFIVRGDGSLVETSAARERAIETILSGPAASAIGARVLTGEDQIVAVDMGGTTTDVAIVTGGRVAVCEEGATVGPWQTSVSAADILTTGLGGDSYVRLAEGGSKLTIGPERVIPLSFLALTHESVREELAELVEASRFDKQDPLRIEFFELVGIRRGMRLTEHEERIIQALDEGPVSRQRLANRVGAISYQLVSTSRLEQLGIVRRCAFTPSDALHVLGMFTEYDADAAVNAAKVLAGFANLTCERFAEWVREEAIRRLGFEIMRRELSLDFGDPAGIDHPMVKDLLAAILAGRKKARGHYAMRFDERRTVVGIGAPAGAFLPEAGELLGAKVIVPEHAEVANAVGAISGKVVVREALSIRPDEVGSFVLTGPMGRKEFGHLRDAEQVAREYLVSYLRTRAREFGTDEKEVTVRVADKTGLLADGSRQFLELVVEGELIGNPRGKHFGF